MKSKILNLLLILTSLTGYLEWGKDNKLFLFQMEAEVISKLFTDPLSVLHPLILLPLFGQVMLLITLFQHKPNKRLTYIAIGGLGALLGLMFVIGILNFNLKILFSTFPFIILAVLTIRNNRRKESVQ